MLGKNLHKYVFQVTLCSLSNIGDISFLCNKPEFQVNCVRYVSALA